MDFGAISDLKKTHGIVRTQHGIVTTPCSQDADRCPHDTAASSGRPRRPHDAAASPRRPPASSDTDIATTPPASWARGVLTTPPTSHDADSRFQTLCDPPTRYRRTYVLSASEGVSPTRGTALRQNRSAAVVESAASQAHCLCPEDCLAGQRKRQTLQRPHPLAPVVDERSKRAIAPGDARQRTSEAAHQRCRT